MSKRYYVINSQNEWGELWNNTKNLFKWILSYTNTNLNKV